MLCLHLRPKYRPIENHESGVEEKRDIVRHTPFIE
jgi:hypothetical protein